MRNETRRTSSRGERVVLDANAGCSTEYVRRGGGRGPCEKVAKTVREVQQCLHVGGSGGVRVGSSVAAGVWWSWRWWWWWRWRRLCGVAGATSVCMRACIGGTRTSPGPWFLALSFARVPVALVPSHSIPRLSIHRDYPPLRRSHGGHRTETDRPSQASHYARWLCVANERPTNQTGKRQPGDKRNMLLRERRARP